jgi:hypothetical protein
MIYYLFNARRRQISLSFWQNYKNRSGRAMISPEGDLCTPCAENENLLASRPSDKSFWHRVFPLLYHLRHLQSTLFLIASHHLRVVWVSGPDGGEWKDIAVMSSISGKSLILSISRSSMLSWILATWLAIPAGRQLGVKWFRGDWFFLVLIYANPCNAPSANFAVLIWTLQSLIVIIINLKDVRNISDN